MKSLVDDSIVTQYRIKRLKERRDLVLQIAQRSEDCDRVLYRNAKRQAAKLERELKGELVFAQNSGQINKLP